MPDASWSKHAENIALEMELANGNCSRPYEWATIHGTMYVGAGDLLAGEVAQMQAEDVYIPEWEDLDRTNLIHQRFHLWQWEKTHPGATVAGLETIVEVGGGYGAMAIVCSKLGFRGNYYIHDMPIMEKVQEAHLQVRELACNVYHGIHPYPDLLIAICSLSEMPAVERDEVLAKMTPASWVLSYQSSWDGVDNASYFAGWASQFPGIGWSIVPGAKWLYMVSSRGKR